MDETTSCMRCGKELPRRRLKEVVHEEGRTRVRQMVCPNCLDQIMNESSRVRGVVGTEKAAAGPHRPGTGDRGTQEHGATRLDPRVTVPLSGRHR